MTDTTTVFALLSESLDVDPLGIRSIHKLVGGIGVRSLPAQFTWWLSVWISGKPEALLPVTVTVTSHDGRQLFFESGETMIPPDGEGDFPTKVGPLSVDEVGPVRVSLSVGTVTWSRPVFVGLIQ